MFNNFANPKINVKPSYDFHVHDYFNKSNFQLMFLIDFAVLENLQSVYYNYYKEDYHCHGMLSKPRLLGTLFVLQTRINNSNLTIRCAIVTIYHVHLVQNVSGICLKLSPK